MAESHGITWGNILMMKMIAAFWFGVGLFALTRVVHELSPYSLDWFYAWDRTWKYAVLAGLAVACYGPVHVLTSPSEEIAAAEPLTGWRWWGYKLLAFLILGHWSIIGVALGIYLTFW
jgi:hypothetical protein